MALLWPFDDDIEVFPEVDSVSGTDPFRNDAPHFCSISLPSDVEDMFDELYRGANSETSPWRQSVQYAFAETLFRADAFRAEIVPSVNGSCSATSSL